MHSYGNNIINKILGARIQNKVSISVSKSVENRNCAQHLASRSELRDKPITADRNLFLVGRDASSIRLVIVIVILVFRFQLNKFAIGLLTSNGLVLANC